MLIGLIIICVFVPILAKFNKKRWLGIGILMCNIGLIGLIGSYVHHSKKGDLSRWRAKRCEKSVKKKVAQNDVSGAISNLYCYLKQLIKTK